MLNQIMKKLVREENGAVLLIVAAGMVVFLGLTAMVVDVGRAETKKFKLANTMDAAALAGVQDLPASTAAAETAARNIVSANGFDPDAVQVEFLNDDSRIRVTSSESLSTLFAGVLGVDTMDVSAKAAAEVSILTGAEGIVPVGINKEAADDLEIPDNLGDTFTLKVGPQDNDTLLGENGWYGALTLNKPGAKTFETNLAEGYDGIIRVDDIIDTETGNMAGPTHAGVQSRLDKCDQGCTLLEHDDDCPRVILVPIYDFLPDQDFTKQIKQVVITGFASFWLEDSTEEGSGANKVCTITGSFINHVTVGEVGGAGAEDYGTYGSRLVE